MGLREIIAFYVLLTALASGVGAYMAVRKGMDPMVGYEIGGAAGLLASWVLWQNYGKAMA